MTGEPEHLLLEPLGEKKPVYVRLFKGVENHRISGIPVTPSNISLSEKQQNGVCDHSD